MSRIILCCGSWIFSALVGFFGHALGEVLDQLRWDRHRAVLRRQSEWSSRIMVGPPILCTSVFWEPERRPIDC
ncbi:uncharacterized protein MYCGRDRAFT_79484 [Zymoseptoria tritici IPO323]|uniref:Uncharacterized protein n=1 Tax=Zymoseptoria tritici (strain CBS 115943 / IPO323) TaxID=336722 RepID=F9X4G9_ZYMTI|nr:uncharacterized protein MYCGRDRAFT_79484 [Zymoseptoria tritici IPO323]EGP89963.1 hypothetical protein MYCGRDRAFT_79484 [Zymoseptoria tritici IPO323]